MIDKIASKTANWIANSKGAQKLFNTISENASQVSVKTANGVNFIARPITIMATTKSQNLLDGAYCASSSVASGIGETINSKIILKPFNKAVQKSTTQLQASGFFQSIGDKVGNTSDGVCKNFKSALGRMMLIALVPLNGLIKMKIHPLLAHNIANLKKSIDKKGNKLNAIG